jgi:thiamine biosynthesis lipoprotein
MNDRKHIKLRKALKNAGKAPVKVDTAMIDFLEYCKELYTLTGGKTNVMMGSVLKIWHDCREEASENFGYLSPDDLPTEEELNEAAKHTSIDSLIIDRESSTVYISDPEASLDVGAIAKGYTVDILYERIKSTGADSVVLNIGGNIRTIGKKPEGGPWVTGLTNPDKDSNEPLIARLEIGETSLVTSGDYERAFISDNKKYHHIIDPDTLMPSEYFSSVSVLAEKSALSDALSTALFSMSYEDGLKLISDIGGIEVVWVTRDGVVKTTDGVRLISK